MSGWDGNGNFVRVYSWIADALAGINITASRMDADTNNITNNGFGNTLTRDGQGSATADLPMNNFRHTGVGNATLRNEYAVVGQIQDTTYTFKAAGGTADALTATFAPAITALVDGMTLGVRATAANTTTTPTFAPNGLTAHTITKFGGTALVAGDIPAAGAEILLRYVLASTRWELLNPAYSSTLAVPWIAAAGTADAITATYAPAILSLTDGLLLSFRATAANATTTPTFAPNGLTAHTITKLGGAALALADIPAALAECLVRYNLANTRWELIDPVTPPIYHSQLITANGTFTIPAGATSTTPFKFTGTGGGGGSGGASTADGATTAGASAAGTFIASFTGFTAGQNVTVAIGAKGAKGIAAAGNGTSGTDTTLTYAAVTVATASHGVLTPGNNSATLAAFTGPDGGTATVAVGASGLTLVSPAILIQGGAGGVAISVNTAMAVSGAGGASYWGPGSGAVGSDGLTPHAPTNYGSGGAGANRQVASDTTGADGVAGVVFIEWWL